MDAALWEHRWECRYFTSLAVCACVCMPVCACIWNRERGLERERERWGRVSISWSLYLCVHLYGLSYFSSLPLSFFSFSIFPLTTSITLKMNITWHGGTYFYDLLYSLTRTFCSLLKEDNTTDTKSPQWFPEPTGLGWMKTPLPSTFCLIGSSFSKGSSIVAGPKTVEMCLCPW